MILYNVTLSVDQTIEIQWLEWMKTKHIQDVLNTGCFTQAKLVRVVSHSQPDSTSYSVQYTCLSNQALKEYKQMYAPKLRQEGLEKFGNKVLAFRTELEVLGDFFASPN